MNAQGWRHIQKMPGEILNFHLYVAIGSPKLGMKDAKAQAAINVARLSKTQSEKIWKNHFFSLVPGI